MATRTETDEEIRVEVPDGGWCRYCPAATAHVHVWTKPSRCSYSLADLQCQRDEGHDRGEFPRYSWDHGLNNIAKIETGPTMHLVEWTTDPA